MTLPKKLGKVKSILRTGVWFLGCHSSSQNNRAEEGLFCPRELRLMHWVQGVFKRSRMFFIESCNWAEGKDWK